MLILICMTAGTVVCIFFGYLFATADNSLTVAMLKNCREMQTEEIKKIKIEMSLLLEHMKRTGELPDKSAVRRAKKLKKKLLEAERLSEAYDKGKISILDMIPVSGYRLMQLSGWDSTNPAIKTLYQKCCQFKEKKEAMDHTYYLLASLLGYSIFGAGVFFSALGICLTLGLGARSFVVSGGIFVFFFLLGYVPYDNVNAIVHKRAEEIERTFPQAVSKLTLLTVAGMEVSQAWKLTSQSGRGTLYEEMNRVLVDLDNNVSPAEAYSKFLTRCNNKYTTKLATSIIQNISKGNAEIVRLFRSLNDESWMEHKHNARRMGEKIQSKLLVPTMLLFVGILILVIVPVMSGFSF